MAYLLKKAHQPGVGTELVQRVDWTPGASGGLGCCCGARAGMGIFETGADFSGWGLGSWAVLALGAYVLVSMFHDTRRAIGRGRKTFRARAAKQRRKAELKRELAAL